ncbi:MAG: hypothetical protein ABSG38_12935 [Spirochaetia bacterium]|jgi:hypothetical protein
MSHALLKSVSRLFPVLVGVTILLILIECGQPGGGGTTNPSDVADVGTVSPSALANSGATITPPDIAAIGNALGAIPSGDPFLKDIGSAFDTIGSMSITGSKGKALGSGSGNTSGIMRLLSAFNGIVNKDLSSDVINQLSKIKTDILNFPTTKTLNETIDLSGDSLGTYVKLTIAKAALTASAVTNDGGPLTETLANFQSAKGQVTLSLVVDPQNLSSAGSAIKDFKIKINAGATASVGATVVGGVNQLSNLVFDYGESAVLALSFNSAGTGGKIVLTANAKNKGTIVDPSPSNFKNYYPGLAPSISVTLTVYDDSGAQKWSQSWNDISALVSAFSGS